MLRKVEKKEILTIQEARKKYAANYFIMIITEPVDHADNDLGYVIYIADNDKELSEVSRDEYRGMTAAFIIGGLAEPYPTVGNVVYYD